MIQLIVGKKGKGKTKALLDKVNEEVNEVNEERTELFNNWHWEPLYIPT